MLITITTIIKLFQNNPTAQYLHLQIQNAHKQYNNFMYNYQKKQRARQ